MPLPSMTLSPSKELGEALYLACCRGRTDLVVTLLASGADPNRGTECDSSLYVACQGGHKTIVAKLLEGGAAVNICSNHGETPLWVASGMGHAEIVRMLVGAGALVNKATTGGITPLWAACSMGHLECVRILSSHAAVRNFIQHTTLRRMTAEGVANDRGHSALAAWLASNPSGSSAALTQQEANHLRVDDSPAVVTTSTFRNTTTTSSGPLQCTAESCVSEGWDLGERLQ